MESVDSKESKYDKSGINKNTYNMLFPNFYDIEKEKIDKKDEKNSLIIQLIEVYTQLQQKEIFTKLVKKKFEEQYGIDFSKIKYNKDIRQYEYEIEGKVYTFNELSNMTDIEEFKKELQTDERYQKCHKRTLELSLGIPESNIVTGYEKAYSFKILHSVLEYKVKNKFYIIDYTKNIVMPKEHYVELTGFEEIERISDLEYINDLLKIYDFPHLTDKVYVTFQKELMRKLEKKGIFEENPIIKKEIQEIKDRKIRKIKEYKKFEDEQR